MNADAILPGFVTLLVTIDPLGLLPVFLPLTHGMTNAERRGIALRATIFTFSILVFFVLAGGHLLEWLAISLPAFRIAGGLLLFWIAFQMAFSKTTEKKQETAANAVTKDHITDIAAVPLAIPLMAGPGAITAVILLSARADGSALGITSLIGLLGAVAAICTGVFMVAIPVSYLLGSTGHLVLSRLLGLILSGLAVQFVIDGVKDTIV